MIKWVCRCGSAGPRSPASRAPERIRLDSGRSIHLIGGGPGGSARRNFVKATVQVHEYADRTIALLHGPGRSPTMLPRATLITEENQTKPAA
jgi:hypothetical protein